MAKLVPYHRSSELPESFPLSTEKIKNIAFIRDWLNLKEQKGKWTLNWDTKGRSQCLFFSNKDTAFACKMRWG